MDSPDVFLKARMPDWLEPMAATLTQDLFSGGEWVFERKFDGIRLLASASTNLRTRSFENSRDYAS